MTNRKLVVLAGAAAVLAGLAYWSGSGRRMRAPEITGKLVMPAGVAEKAARIEITGGAKPLKLAAKENGWQIESLWGYPADIAKIRANVLKLGELKVGQLARGKAFTRRQLVDLQDAAGKSLATLALGDKHLAKERGQMAQFGGGAHPDGRYVQMGSDTVLVSDTLEAFDGNVRDWADTRIASVSAADVTRVVFGYKSGSAILSRKDGSWKMEGLGAKEELDSGKTYSLDSALSYLDFTDVADPAKTSAEYGFATGAVYTATLKNGISYIAEIGNVVADGRYVKLSASFSPVGTNETENAMCRKTVKNFNEARAKWTYVVAGYSADALVKTRKDLVKAKEEPKKQEPAPKATK